MAENTYSVGYSTNARAKCKYSGCGETIAKDDLRFTKSAASAFSDRPKCEYYHAKCIFLSFVRARKTTKKIESMSDIEGVEGIKPEEKAMIKKLLKEWKAGDMKDQVPKITRKRKGDDEEDDKKKKKKKTENKSKKSKKSQDSDEEEPEEEEEEYKPQKSRKVTKSSDSKQKKSAKKKAESDEEEDDEDDENFNRILTGKSSTSKKIPESDSEEDAKPKSKAKSKTKNSKKQKKSQEESVEEVKESASEEEENEKFLSGKIIAIYGKLSVPREKTIQLIEKNGGKYSERITDDVTHVICAKVDGKTQKLQKAKEEGKILVTESFF